MRNPIRLKNLSARFLPAYLLLALALWWASPAPADLMLGVPLVVLGGGVRAWGAGHLVKTDELTLTGPYAYLRHPLYLGTLLVGLGFSLLVGGGVGLAVALAFAAWFFLAYFPRKESAEGARLVERYGEAYARYRREVRALWPRLRPWRLEATGSLPSRRAGEAWRFSRFSENNELGTSLALALGLVLFAFRAL